jgi:hypothetical protein
VAPAEVLALTQEMTLSRDEFLRSLSGAVAGAAFEAQGSDIRPLDPAQAWRIALTPLPELRIGAIRLPRHRVAIYLAGRDEAATRRFLERFEQYFRRGGG